VGENRRGTSCPLCFEKVYSCPARRRRVGSCENAVPLTEGTLTEAGWDLGGVSG
jgi:hypothetical protein